MEFANGIARNRPLGLVAVGLFVISFIFFMRCGSDKPSQPPTAKWQFEKVGTWTLPAVTTAITTATTPILGNMTFAGQHMFYPGGSLDSSGHYQSHLFIVDMVNPTSPTTAASYSFPVLNRPWYLDKLLATDTRLFAFLRDSVGGGECPNWRVDVFDITNPEEPDLLYSIPGSPECAWPMATLTSPSVFAWSPTGYGKVIFFDALSTEADTLGILTGSMFIDALFGFESNLYLLENSQFGYNLLTVYDVSNPALPQRLTSGSGLAIEPRGPSLQRLNDTLLFDPLSDIDTLSAQIRSRVVDLTPASAPTLDSIGLGVTVVQTNYAYLDDTMLYTSASWLWPDPDGPKLAAWNAKDFAHPQLVATGDFGNLLFGYKGYLYHEGQGTVGIYHLVFK